MLHLFRAKVWQPYVTELRDGADADMLEHRKIAPPGRVSRDVAVVCFTAALSLLFVRFAGREEDTAWAVKALSFLGFDGAAADLARVMAKNASTQIYRKVWWASARVIGYGVIPLLATIFLLKQSPLDLGLRGKGDNKRLYLLLLVLVLPLVVAASFDPAFQSKYPYYKLARDEQLWPHFACWELLYASQFVALEFFFRGFLIHGLKRSLGYAAVFVPIMPYAMIHFGKPLPEALGSVFTGFLLGTVALKTKSIWGGAAIHVSVAWAMDLLSIWHAGHL